MRGIAESESGSISELPTLKKLTLQSNLRSLEHLRGLNKLEKLVLLDCKNLNDLSALTEFTHLRWLAMDGSKKIADFTPLESLTNLEVLDLSNCGKIPSLAPLVSLQKLKSLAFAGSTTSIEDGDLSLLTSLPELSMLMFAPRKHYSHRLLKDWDWNNFHHPDKLLEAKAH